MRLSRALRCGLRPHTCSRSYGADSIGRRVWTTIGLMLLLTGTCIGCSSPAVHTTFLGSVDLVDMTDRMAESFTGDTAIGRRTEVSETWIVSIDRIVNHTNEIIPSREKWLYTTRLRARLAESRVSRDRNIVWVVPPEQWPAASGEHPTAAGRMRPTHLLAAEFQTLTRTSSAGRSDTYVCAFQLTNIEDGRLVWEDIWEVKYAASGLTWD